jgi:uncharacterized protein DUF898
MRPFGTVNLWPWLMGSWVTNCVILGIVAYPAYQAIVMRWWLGGLRLGGAPAASDLRIRLYYFAYLRYLLCVVLFSIACAAVLGVGVALLPVGMPGEIDFSTPGVKATGLAASAILAYVIYMLGVSTIDHIVVKMRRWQAAVESVAISGIAALDHVQASETTSSASGEGLADALGIGAI